MKKNGFGNSVGIFFFGLFLLWLTMISGIIGLIVNMVKINLKY